MFWRPLAPRALGNEHLAYSLIAMTTRSVSTHFQFLPRVVALPRFLTLLLPVICITGYRIVASSVVFSSNFHSHPANQGNVCNDRAPPHFRILKWLSALIF